MNNKNSEIAHTSSTPHVNDLLSRSSAADANQGASGYYPLSIDENPLYSVSPSAKQIVLTGDPRYAFTDAWQGFIKVTSSGLYRIQIIADDGGSFSIGGVTTELTGEGQARPSEAKEVQLEAGYHSAGLTYFNIAYLPEDGNAASFTAIIERVSAGEGGASTTLYDIADVSDGYPYPPKPSDPDPSDPDTPVEPQPTPPITEEPIICDPCGCQTGEASAHLSSVDWRLPFGKFFSIPGMPAGGLALKAPNINSNLDSPSALQYIHISQRRLESFGAQGLAAFSATIRAEDNSLRQYLLSQGDASFRLGSTQRLNSLARQKGNSQIEEVLADGSILLYDIESKELVSITTKFGQTVSSKELRAQLNCVRSAEGQLRQIWQREEGLLDIVILSAQSYRIDWYPVDQVGAQDAQGHYSHSGAPYKSYSFTRENNSLRYEETRLGSPESHHISWQHRGNTWIFTQGLGDEAIVTEKKSSIPSGNRWVSNTTVRKADGTIARQTEDIQQSSYYGTVLLSRKESIGGSQSQRTEYFYEEDSNSPHYGRLLLIMTPDGHTIKYAYDALGRIISEKNPWVGGGFLDRRTSYRDTSFNSPEASSIVEVIILDGEETELKRKDYVYSEDASVRRVEMRSTALGAPEARLSIEETWAGESANPFARGRIKMEQAIDGTQRHYDYEASQEEGVLYTVRSETRVEGDLIPGKSLRNIRHISPQGNLLRTEDYALLTDQTWALINRVDYEYNPSHQWIKRTQANGRNQQRVMMCCGPLWEKNEDGVTTSYAYDSARQLIETIRSETPTSPESITSYRRDALGRVLETRSDIGAMTSSQTTSYDLLGRSLTSTDILGRNTRYSYSEDGLSTTTTSPTGAYSISQRHPDGSLIRESGSAVTERNYSVALLSNGIQTTTRNGGNVILSQSIANGFGETMQTIQPNTLGGNISTQRSYNSKGQLIQEQSEDLDPLLYSYDEMGNLKQKRQGSTGLRTTDYSNSYEQQSDGIYQSQSITQYNAQGGAILTQQAQLISALSPNLESKSISTDPRGNISTQWTEYGVATQRNSYSQIPSSNITASKTVIDGVMTAQSDHAGVTSQQTISYISSGMRLSQTDGRGNTSTILSDIAGRTLTVTDAAGNTESRSYSNCCDNPASISDALGNTTHYKYDQRNRKTAEWGSNIQPACFAYDDENRIISLKTFRVNESDINSDPTERSDGDTTTWEYHDATGLDLTKTYADGSKIRKEYNALGLLGHLHNARGNKASYAYNSNTGTLKSIQHTDGTAPQSFSYNQLDQITEITDASGIRMITYNEYNEASSENLNGDEISHLISETQDSYGRNTGYSYSKAGILQQSVNIGYGEEGRIATTSFLHEGIEQQFSYSYLEGSHLLHTLAHPNNILLSNTYEEQRNLITSMNVTRGTTDVVLRSYSYDALARPLSRDCGRRATSRNDNFTYNTRSELIQAELGSKHYAYSYDNIGNRKTAQELAEESTYEANQLNQYTEITEGETAFTPTFDADGNQTLIKTSTGIWSVVYNADNRPTSFSQAQDDQSTIIECGYDYMGRRYTKKVTSNGTVSLHQRYIYRGYLQIACVDLTRSEHPALWYITWDPTEPVATRPLAIQKNATWYSYSHDLTKNVTELYQSDGLIATTYDYSPYGAATAEGTDQPLQWSSEYHDPELALTYYNYRHYNPTDGRWINRDPIGEDGGFNLYGFVRNNALLWGDSLGQAPSRSDIEKALRETRLLLDQIQGRDKAKSQECCSDMYNEYLGKLSQLIKDVGEFYEDQWWISDEDQKAMGDVYALPSLIDGATMTPEQLSTLGDAVRSASKSMENNIFNKYCEEIQNGADFAAGFSDGAFFGLGEYISDYTSKLLYGEDTPWPSLDNGWYAGGIVTAFVTTTASYGFVGLPKNMIHFTTNAGAKGIKASGTINATKGGAFGPGTYMTQVGRPINLFVSKTSTVPIYLARPSGTVRIIPKLVYLRPFRSVKLP